MPKEARETISEAVGCKPVLINASLVSAQNRKRLFWVCSLQLDGTYKGIDIPQPEDKHIYLKDIILDGAVDRDKSLVVVATYSRATPKDYFEKSSSIMAVAQSFLIVIYSGLFNNNNKLTTG
jgi:DNA (cytosine-5)-methyltransferase 3A